MKFIPELNYWFYLLRFSGPINEYPYNFPVEIKDKWVVENSVISLLFNESYKQPDYNLLYKRVKFASITEPTLSNRVSLYLGNIDIYTCYDSKFDGYWLDDSSPANIFEFTPEEITLLNALLMYKITGTDSSTGLNVIIFDNLQSGLSKMIYMYLELMLYGRFSLYNNDTKYANNNRLIELFYEKFLIDCYFRYFKNNYLTLDSTTTLNIIELQPITEILIVDQQAIDDKRIPLKSSPRELEDIIVLKDGFTKKIVFDYEIYIQNSITYISWAGLALQEEIQLGDKILISYSFEN